MVEPLKMREPTEAKSETKLEKKKKVRIYITRMGGNVQAQEVQQVRHSETLSKPTGSSGWRTGSMARARRWGQCCWRMTWSCRCLKPSVEDEVLHCH